MGGNFSVWVCPRTIRTPNILATSHRLPETRDQYFISSRWAPSTLSTTSSVLASILWTISLVGRKGGSLVLVLFLFCFSLAGGIGGEGLYVPLLGDHGCKLTEYTAEFTDGFFNHVDGFAAHVDICIRWLRFFHHEELLVGCGSCLE